MEHSRSLHFAALTVGMTILFGNAEKQRGPSNFASVETTICLDTWSLVSQMNCHPDRSEAQRSGGTCRS